MTIGEGSVRATGHRHDLGKRCAREWWAPVGTPGTHCSAAVRPVNPADRSRLGSPLGRNFASTHQADGSIRPTPGHQERRPMSGQKPPSLGPSPRLLGSRFGDYGIETPDSATLAFHCEKPLGSPGKFEGDRSKSVRVSRGHDRRARSLNRTVVALGSRHMVSARDLPLSKHSALMRPGYLPD